MKAAPLLIEWHNDKSPIWSVHFEPHGRGRLATAGGDNNVRIWQVDEHGDERKFTYLSTLSKHTQAVNVVRWCPKSGQEVLASAGDDGNVLLWVPSDVPPHIAYGSDGPEDKETWQVKRVNRSTSFAEIYDLAWSPDGNFFVTGSMDNVARIFDAHTGSIVRQIAEHNNYVQGVAWDPLNEFLATQSSDRSVHIYKLRTNDGQFSLAQHSRIARMDLPARRISSNPPVVPDFGARAQFAEGVAQTTGSPLPSAPGTPNSLALPMNPPPPSHSRRSSFGAISSPSVRRSASPAPSLPPLPAVMPPASPNPFFPLTARNAELYANETLTSFFRRLTFTPDGSLLLTPAGQYKTLHPNHSDSSKPIADIANTVYIYSRAGLNKPPIAHLPGHKKPSIAVKCSPLLYELRQPMSTKHITVDTASSGENEGDLTPLPEPVVPSKVPTSYSTMEPPPLSAPSPAPSQQGSTPNAHEGESGASILGPGPPPAFALPYRVVYAVATQDAVLVYDTQQQTPICIVSNLHFSTFTDLTWSSDGLTLLMASSDGFCSALNFLPGELGIPYQGPAVKHHRPSISSVPSHSTPAPTPTHPPLLKHTSSNYKLPPSPAPSGRPASPARSNSTSSIATMTSFAPPMFANDPVPTLGCVPSVAASATYAGTAPPLTSPTPPMTPLPSGTSSFAAPPQVVLGKREGDEVTKDDTKEPKKRRIAPTLLSSSAQEQ